MNIASSNQDQSKREQLASQSVSRWLTNLIAMAWKSLVYPAHFCLSRCCVWKSKLGDRVRSTNRELKQTTTTTATWRSKTITEHVRYKSLYISLPSSALSTERGWRRLIFRIYWGFLKETLEVQIRLRFFFFYVLTATFGSEYMW